MAFSGDDTKINRRAQFEPQSADPPNPSEGDEFYSDGTPRAAGKWTYNGSAWVQFASAGTVNLNRAIRSEVANYTATSTDAVIFCSGAAFTVTLPAAASNSGKEYWIKKTDASFTNIITIDGNASETIDGATTTTLNTINEQLHIVSDGTNWQILDRKTKTPKLAYTPTIVGLGTVTNEDFRWWRDGEYLYVEGIFTAGVATAVIPTISHPSGLDHDTAKFPSPNRMELGQYYRGITAANTNVPVTNRGPNPISDRTGSTSTVYFSISVDLAGISSGTMFNETNASLMGTNNAGLVVQYRVPIDGWNQ